MADTMQRVEYNGEVHEFPADFTDADIAKALKQVDTEARTKEIENLKQVTSTPLAAEKHTPTVFDQSVSESVKGIGKGIYNSIAEQAKALMAAPGQIRDKGVLGTVAAVPGFIRDTVVNTAKLPFRAGAAIGTGEPEQIGRGLVDAASAVGAAMGGVRGAKGAVRGAWTSDMARAPRAAVADALRSGPAEALATGADVVNHPSVIVTGRGIVNSARNAAAKFIDPGPVKALDRYMPNVGSSAGRTRTPQPRAAAGYSPAEDIATVPGVDRYMPNTSAPVNARIAGAAGQFDAAPETTYGPPKGMSGEARGRTGFAPQEMTQADQLQGTSLAQGSEPELNDVLLKALEDIRKPEGASQVTLGSRSMGPGNGVATADSAETIARLERMSKYDPEAKAAFDEYMQRQESADREWMAAHPAKPRGATSPTSQIAEQARTNAAKVNRRIADFRGTNVEAAAQEQLAKMKPASPVNEQDLTNPRVLQLELERRALERRPSLGQLGDEYKGIKPFDKEASRLTTEEQAAAPAFWDEIINNYYGGRR